MLTRYPKRLAKKLLHGLGYDLTRLAASDARTRIPEMTDADLAIVKRVTPYTMTSLERIWSCMQAVRYVAARGLDGDFVECGVWRGGSSMAAALTFSVSTSSAWIRVPHRLALLAKGRWPFHEVRMAPMHSK